MVGYAFRHHWFWVNNYGMSSQTFIIWKDYKCEAKSMESADNVVNLAPNFQAQSALSADSSLATDVWKWTYELQQRQLGSGPKSIIGYLDRPAQYSVRFCMSPSFGRVIGYSQDYVIVPGANAKFFYFLIGTESFGIM